jgi:arylsulfatase I/J
VGWHNNGSTITPNLDHLAHTGLELNRHYVQRWCAATRTALLTGRYTYNTGMMDYNHGVEEERSAVPSSFAMLPKLLKQAPIPYKTHMLGKWHLGFFTQAHTPVGRGFDTSFGFFCGDSTHDTRGSQVSHTCRLSITDLYNSTHTANESGPHGGWATNRVYNTHMYAALAAEVITTHGREQATATPSQPLFLYMAFQNSHAPYQCPDKYLDLYPQWPLEGSRRCFNGMVSAVDGREQQIGDSGGSLEPPGPLS